MGMFDSIFIDCPKCGESVEMQSKSGDCLMRTYQLKDAPLSVLQDVNRHSPHKCSCGFSFKVDFDLVPMNFRLVEVLDKKVNVASLDEIIKDLTKLKDARPFPCASLTEIIGKIEKLK